MFYIVRLWRENALSPQVRKPVICERVQAPSEGHAVVQVMRRYRLKYAACAWVSPTEGGSPTVRLAHVMVKGKRRSWKFQS